VVVEPGVIETAFGVTATEGVLKRSGSGTYAKLAQAVARATKNTYGHGRGTDPSAIADIVSKAVKPDKPRTRSVASKYAKPMIMMRHWLGDRMFDRLVMSQMTETGLPSRDLVFLLPNLGAHAGHLRHHHAVG
jgi:hypothetical protein